MNTAMIKKLTASTLFLLISAGFLQAAKDPEWISLFDGKTLNGWVQIGQHGRGYVVENGLLVCPVDGGGNIFTVKEYANFVLQFEFRMEPNGNNGVGIRAPLEGDAAYAGMEIQILDNDGPEYKGKLRPAQYHGSVYDVIPAKLGFLKKAGEWNREEIMANGRNIRVTLNGTVILESSLDSIKDREVLKHHPGLSRTHGHLGFLGHDSRMEFRNIQLKELP